MAVTSGSAARSSIPLSGIRARIVWYCGKLVTTSPPPPAIAVSTVELTEAAISTNARPAPSGCTRSGIVGMPLAIDSPRLSLAA
jgi:hypothetical protein